MVAMDSECKRTSRIVKIDERSVREQEHRKTSRLWEKIVQKHSSTVLDVSEASGDEEDPKRGVRFRSSSATPRMKGDDSEEEAQEEGAVGEGTPESPSSIKRRMAKVKSFGKRKSPLQKFDEVVTRELLNRQYSDEEGMCPFDNQNWPNMDVNNPGWRAQFSISKTALNNAEKELLNKDKDPSDVENAALLDAIDKLFQAQVSCRFDAAVKAAEAAASSVPPEMAEEVAVECAKDYQSTIIDIVNDKVPMGEGKMPMEVIGYIGITKLKDNLDDD